MTMPTPERIGKYAERLVSAARDMVAEPNDMKPREAYMRAAFNLDWTAAAIVALADEGDSQRTALREAEARAETAEGKVAAVEAADRAASKWRDEFSRQKARALALEARATTAETALAQAREALEPFAKLAREVLTPGSPDYLAWLETSRDWMVIFSFGGHSISLGELRKLHALPQPKDQSHG